VGILNSNRAFSEIKLEQHQKENMKAKFISEEFKENTDPIKRYEYRF